MEGVHDSYTRRGTAQSMPLTVYSPRQTLASHVLTPNDAFYVRNHAPVPVVDPKEHRICFSNTHGQSVAYMSVDELKQKYGTTVVTSVLQV